MRDIRTLAKTIEFIERREYHYGSKFLEVPLEDFPKYDIIIEELGNIKRHLQSALNSVAEARLEADGI